MTILFFLFFLRNSIYGTRIPELGFPTKLEIKVRYQFHAFQTRYQRLSTTFWMSRAHCGSSALRFERTSLGKRDLSYFKYKLWYSCDVGKSLTRFTSLKGSNSSWCFLFSDEPAAPVLASAGWFSLSETWLTKKKKKRMNRMKQEAASGVLLSYPVNYTSLQNNHDSLLLLLNPVNIIFLLTKGHR